MKQILKKIKCFFGRHIYSKPMAIKGEYVMITNKKPAWQELTIQYCLRGGKVIIKKWPK